MDILVGWLIVWVVCIFVFMLVSIFLVLGTSGDCFELGDTISDALVTLLGIMVLLSSLCGAAVWAHYKANYKIEQEQSCPAVETSQDKDDKIEDVSKQIEGLEKEVVSLKE